MRYLLTLLCYVLFCHTLSAQTTDSTFLEGTDISILTCRSGDQLYSTFGHTAIRIQNRVADLDDVYNYGLFSFDTPNFYLKFMRGQLPYRLGRTKMQYFLQEYQYDERSVLEQKLLLQNDEKREVIRFLGNNILPENREYAYDFFYDNCATRVVDVYGLAGDSVVYDNKVQDKTFRDLLKENLKSLPWSDFGIDLVIGARADDRVDRRGQMFLPSYLMDNLAAAKVHRGITVSPLASPASVVLDYEVQNKGRQSKSFPWPLICTVMLLLLTLVINWKSPRVASVFNKVLLGVGGVLGIFLIFMWFGTNHGATRDNWNVMWLNPLLLFVVFSTSLRSNKILKMALLLLFIIAFANCIVTFLPQFFHFAFLPIILSLAISLWRLTVDVDSVEVSSSTV